MDDSSSPYILTNGDHPCMVIISHLLNGNNFNTWNRAMAMALTAKNKLRFVDKSLPHHRFDDLLFNAWVRCNSMVISWILDSVSKEIADSWIRANGKKIKMKLRNKEDIDQSNARR